VASLPWDKQWAAVRIRSPPAESSTAPVQVCNEALPTKTAPTLRSGGTGFAVTGLAAVAAGTVVEAVLLVFVGLLMEAERPHDDVNAAASRPVTRAIRPAAEKRITLILPEYGRGGTPSKHPGAQVQQVRLTGTPDGMRHWRHHVGTDGWAAVHHPQNERH
jgi:hypothetical protein